VSGEGDRVIGRDARGSGVGTSTANINTMFRASTVVETNSNMDMANNRRQQELLGDGSGRDVRRVGRNRLQDEGEGEGDNNKGIGMEQRREYERQSSRRARGTSPCTTGSSRHSEMDVLETGLNMTRPHHPRHSLGPTINSSEVEGEVEQDLKALDDEIGRLRARLESVALAQTQQIVSQVIDATSTTLKGTPD